MRQAPRLPPTTWHPRRRRVRRLPGLRRPAPRPRPAATVVVSVTVGSALDAMRSLRGGLSRGPFVLDVNSVSPAVKQKAARIIEAAGGRYVEAAVMTSVPPKGLCSPMFLGGPHAAAFMAVMVPFGMDVTDFAPDIGRTSSVKMCRSVMIKGLEPLLSRAIAERRDWAWRQGAAMGEARNLPTLKPLLDAIATAH